MNATSALENYFAIFRDNTIGPGQTFESPFGTKEIVYADWTATGRAYRPIEEVMQRKVLPFLANTHTGTTITGTLMSEAYEQAKEIIKKHVHAGSDDVLLFCGSGMTAAVNKLQRILGLRIPERVMEYMQQGCKHLPIDEALRPVVFVTHMEHHSNHISWLETVASVEIINADKTGNVNINHFRSLLEQYRHRPNKIAAITACSNVTGIETPYYEIAKLIHEYNGYCFVDFAGSAPYINMDMHPIEQGAYLDAIYFSPHKFLGGAGTPGILVFNKCLYKNAVPDQPGGGTLLYSNPWKVHEYVTCIEQREDGGTPPFLQGIKAALCLRLKDTMGVKNIHKRKEELLQIAFERFAKISNVEVLEASVHKRLGIIAFTIHGAHYNLVVKLLNDHFGIQTRGGCSCAGTYGHLLLHVDAARSYKILNSIRSGNLSGKPGWVRLSIHPTITNAEMCFIMDAIEQTALHFMKWGDSYNYSPETNEYTFKAIKVKRRLKAEDCFDIFNKV